MRNLMATSSILGNVTCEARAATLYLERNAFICGLSVFLFLVLRRLMEIQHQLFEMRSAVKQVGVLAADGRPGG